MPDEKIIVMNSQGEKYRIPKADLGIAIGRGFFPEAQTPTPDLQPVRGSGEALRREFSLGAADMSLPGGERFSAPSLQEVLSLVKNPLASTKEVGSVVGENIAGIPASLGSLMEGLGTATAQAQQTELEGRPVEGRELSGEETEELANTAGKGAGVVASILAAKKLPQTKVPTLTEITRGAFPSFTRAAKNFEDVLSAAEKVPIQNLEVGQAAIHARKLAQSGGQMPKVIRDFLRRINDPDLPPITYGEARDFYSNATRLSADEFNRLTPVMKREVTEFTRKLRSATEEAAESVGKSEQFNAAMEEFAKASGRARTKEELKRLAVKMLKAGAIGGAAAGGGYAVYEALQK